MRPNQFNKVTLLTLFLASAPLLGCSSTTVVAENPVLPTVPEYVRVPHPVNFELSSLRGILYSSLAPNDIFGSFPETCAQEFQKLVTMTQSLDERKSAAIEMVSADPERMHWCFYSKISKLQETLQGNTTWKERQDKVFDTFTFLTPIANAFLNTYHDSRYLRWASQYYSKISEMVFYRKVQTTPDSTLAIVQNSQNDLEPWLPVKNSPEKESVFAKYGISFNPTIASGPSPLEQAPRAPASTPDSTKQP